MDKLQASSSELYENFCLCLASFVVNYLIYMYANESRKEIVAAAGFQACQVLIVELRNYCSFLYATIFVKKDQSHRLFGMPFLKKLLTILDI